MDRVATIYDGQPEPYHYNVTFITNTVGVRLVKSFESERMARQFVNKLKRSKRCTLVSYPIFK